MILWLLSLVVVFAGCNVVISLEIHESHHYSHRHHPHRKGKAHLGQKQAPHALITGGCGFVGRHFTKRLCDMGYRVTIVDNMISESALPLPHWPQSLKPRDSCEIIYHEMDCRDFFLSGEANHHYDLFVHLAAVVGGRAKIEGSPVAVADDLAIDATAFQWAIDTSRKAMPTHMIYFSSSAAYPIKHQTVHSGIQLEEKMIDLEHDNADIAKPDLTYGWAKLTGEYLAKLSAQYYHLNVSVYRPMSGYGEDQHEAYPFKSILLKTTKRLNPVPIWSDAVRDFVHIEDIVTCVLKSYPTIANAAPVNLATGIATSFTDLAKMMAKAVGYEAEVAVQNGMPQGVMYRVGNPNHEHELGCEMKISLTEGIHRALAFLKEEERLKNHTSIKAIEDPTQDDDEVKEHIHPDARSNLHPKVPVDHNIFSSFSCLGASQYVPEEYWKWSRSWWKFPLNDPEFRACRFHNVCWQKDTQKLVYYQDPEFNNQSAYQPFSLDAWQQQSKGILYTGAIAKDPFTFLVDHSSTGIPKDYQFDHTTRLHYYESNSYSYNYGHYLFDDVYPHFTMTEQFGYSFPTITKRQVFSSSCREFGFSNIKAEEIVAFNHSLGTYRQACTDRLNSKWKYFFDAPPVYLEPLYSNNICFQTLFMGQSSMYSLKNVDSSRAAMLRKFRDYVIQRMEKMMGKAFPEPQNRILVGIRGPGHTQEVMPDLCELINHQYKQERVLFPTLESYEIICIMNQDLSLEEEISYVRSSKILISEHGTISHMSLFARDGTQQIVLVNPKDNRYKEHNVLMYVTHVHVMFHSLGKMEELGTILRLAVQSFGIYEKEEQPYLAGEMLSGGGAGKVKIVDSKQLEAMPTMIPRDGVYIQCPARTGDRIYRMQNGKKIELSESEKKEVSTNHHIFTLENFEFDRIP